MRREKARPVTSPGLALPGPHPGARPGVGARQRAPGGRAFPHGARPGPARRNDVGPSSRGPTTCGRSHEGRVQRDMGGSRRQEPRRPDLWTWRLALGTWNVTSLGGKEPELVREVECYRLDIVGLTSTHSLGSGTQLLESSWEFAQPVHMCFVDLEKAFDRVPHSVLFVVALGVRGPGLFAKAVRSLYDRSRSCVRIASSKSDLFPVHVGLRQGCPLSPVLFIIFMDRISRRSQGPEGVWFGNHRILSLLFADDVVLMASSSQDLQQALGRFVAKCEAAGLRISSSKSEAMVLDRKKVACPLRVGGESLPQVKEFKYLGVLFRSEGRMEREIDRCIGAASAVMWSLYRSVEVKKELSPKAKLSIYWSIYVPTLTYGHELWVMTERTRSQIQAAEMGFLCRVAGCTLRDRVRSSVTQEECGVETLLLHVKSNQLRWLGHLLRMPPGRLPRGVFWACPTGRRPRGRPRTRWRDYVSWLAWEPWGSHRGAGGRVQGEGSLGVPA
ncbi:hypothetical protein NQD34_006712 [Periophthalmus magnuspinnatus]|nr:hypothetical protein NQD34_006712 [Periophthalmus magnuspinnatus]